MTMPSDTLNEILEKKIAAWSSINKGTIPHGEPLAQMRWESLCEYLDADQEELSDALDHAESDEDDCNCEQALRLQKELDALLMGLDFLHDLVWTEEKRVNGSRETIEAAADEIKKLREQLKYRDPFMHDFFLAVDKEIEQPNGGTLADLYDDRFILGRLLSESGILSDALYEMVGLDKLGHEEEVIHSQCVKVAACALLVLIRRRNDAQSQS